MGSQAGVRVAQQVIGVERRTCCAGPPEVRESQLVRSLRQVGLPAVPQADRVGWVESNGLIQRRDCLGELLELKMRPPYRAMEDGVGFREAAPEFGLRMAYRQPELSLGKQFEKLFHQG